MLPELLGPGDEAGVKRWGDRLLAVFLVGGTVGGVLFGSLADRVGRKPTMALTGGAARRLAALVPNGQRAEIHLTITDDFPLAQAFVIIEALPPNR